MHCIYINSVCIKVWYLIYVLICVYIFVWHSYLRLFIWVSRHTHFSTYAHVFTQLHVALSNPRFKIYNMDIFAQKIYYGGNSRLYLIYFFFISKSVWESTLHGVGTHEYPRWLYLSKESAFVKLMIITGTNKPKISVGHWRCRSSPAPWWCSFPFLGFSFFLFNMRVLHETAPDSLWVITCFAFLFLAIFKWTARLSLATVLETE